MALLVPGEIKRHELPESEHFCAHDGRALVEIDVEISEQLNDLGASAGDSASACQIRLPVLRFRHQGEPSAAEDHPARLFTEAALAWIATGKYPFGMPLYRQAGLLCRFGGDISSNMLACSMVRVGLATQPVINLMGDALLDAALTYCDETTSRY
jgi:transposase